MPSHRGHRVVLRHRGGHRAGVLQRGGGGVVQGRGLHVELRHGHGREGGHGHGGGGGVDGCGGGQEAGGGGGHTRRHGERHEALVEAHDVPVLQAHALHTNTVRHVTRDTWPRHTCDRTWWCSFTSTGSTQAV